MLKTVELAVKNAEAQIATAGVMPTKTPEEQKAKAAAAEKAKVATGSREWP